MENTKIFGQKLLVEQILEDVPSLAGSKKEFRGRVKVLAIPSKDETLLSRDPFCGINVGDEIIVAGVHKFWDESYVVESQIIRWA